jgi:hypothetical protein
VRALPAHEPHTSVHDRHEQHRDRVARRAALAVRAGWPFRFGHRTLTAVCRYRIRGIKTRAERRGARAAPADLEERRACQGAPGSVKRVSRVASRSSSPPLQPAGVACFRRLPCRQLFPPSWKGDTYIAILGEGGRAPTTRRAERRGGVRPPQTSGRASVLLGLWRGRHLGRRTHATLSVHRVSSVRVPLERPQARA